MHKIEQTIEIKGKIPEAVGASGISDLVEARGVEPLSENTSTGTSPGAFDYLHSLAGTETETLTGLVAS